MAVSGHNGNNETLIRMSSSAGLKLYDRNANEIKITQSITPIEMFLMRDLNAFNYSFEYINATSLGFLEGSYFLRNSFKIQTINASIHIEIKPINTSIGYLLVVKLGYMPLVNKTSADYSWFQIFCPSKKDWILFLFWEI